MEVTKITKISMSEVASLARDGFDEEDRNDKWENLMADALIAINRELQEHLDLAETVYVGGVELCNAEKVTVMDELGNEGEPIGLELIFSDDDDRKVAIFRVLISKKASIKITSHGHGAIFITYGKE